VKNHLIARAHFVACVNTNLVTTGVLADSMRLARFALERVFLVLEVWVVVRRLAGRGRVLLDVSTALVSSDHLPNQCRGGELTRCVPSASYRSFHLVSPPPT